MYGAERNGHKGNPGRQYLQKWQLHFKRMLCAVRHAVFSENRALLLERGRQCLVNWCVAERRSPSSAGKNGEGFAARKMPDSENHNSLRQSDAGKDGSGDMPRNNVAGVRHQASLHGLGFGVRLWRRIFADQRGQFFRIGGIEAPSDGRKAKHGRARKNQIALEGFPLILTALCEAGSYSTVTLSPYW